MLIFAKRLSIQPSSVTLTQTAISSIDIDMTIDTLLQELNDDQRQAATTTSPNTLVLAGAGSGKTKTIVARAAHLIDQGVPADQIQIVTFTRRAASEIVSRVEAHLGERAAGLKASTFHTFCLAILRRYSHVFDLKGFNIIDRDDQLMMFKLIRAKLENAQNEQNPKKSNQTDRLPKPKELADTYSYARNTQCAFKEALQKHLPDFMEEADVIKQMMKDYEQQKQARRYLDYDDILEYVARYLNADAWLLDKVSGSLQHLLVDEMQDTNPLQWLIIKPLIGRSHLFCVGDDAQSIYGFRGADFQNIHSFDQRVPGAKILTLTVNYRSTQGILDLSNWLLEESPLDYKKRLTAHRGSGIEPKLYTFANEFEEARWIIQNLKKRYDTGSPWHHHMILLRSAYSGRQVESALIDAGIPYMFIGGVKLMESAHVKDLLSMLRVTANPADELAWIRFLTLWRGIGDAGAAKLTNEMADLPDLKARIELLRQKSKVPEPALNALTRLIDTPLKPEVSVGIAVDALIEQLEQNYDKKNWPSRVRDFDLIKQLAKRHDTLIDFIEAYILEPVSYSEVTRQKNDDVVTLITIHSAKGTECEVCYIVNASVGQYPHARAAGSIDEIEEERRVLYVAMTRAKDELILTRQNTNTWSMHHSDHHAGAESYFLSHVPDDLLINAVPEGAKSTSGGYYEYQSRNKPKIGIDWDSDELIF